MSNDMPVRREYPGHTPGPWHVDTVPTSCGRCHKILDSVRPDNGHQAVACIYDDDTSLDRVPSNERLATASLIADAPDILRERNEVVAYLGYQQQEIERLRGPGVDDILLQEIQSLREKVRILIQIVRYYEPEDDMIALIHSLGSIDYQEYITGCADDLRQEVSDLTANRNQVRDAIAAMMSDLNELLGDMPNLERAPTLEQDCENVVQAVSDLTAKLERVRRLADPWPLVDILTQLVTAADHLHRNHSCDRHGYERDSAAMDAARDLIESLSTEVPSHE